MMQSSMKILVEIFVARRFVD